MEYNTRDAGEIRAIATVRRAHGAAQIALEVHAGECLVLLGPSGCGKTTLLRVLAGLERADSGRVFIGDRDVSDVGPADRDVAMVFQNYALYPHFTVGGNIAFPLRARRIESSEIERRARSRTCRSASRWGTRRC